MKIIRRVRLTNIQKHNIVGLRYHVGKSIKEISEITGVSDRTVWSFLHRYEDRGMSLEHERKSGRKIRSLCDDPDDDIQLLDPALLE